MTKIIGTDNTGAAAGSGGLIRHTRFAALKDGAISSIELRSSAAGIAKIGIYADEDGEPGALLAANNDGCACQANEWNSIQLKTYVELTDGVYYWLTSIISDTGVTRGTTGIGDTRFKTYPIANDMPDPAGTGYTVSTFEYSLRAFDITSGTNAIQEGDVRMWMVDDRGEIEEKDGFITMTGSFETMIMLALFGGNEDDNRSESTELLQWWGNEGEPVENQYRSRFQYECSRGQPITSGSITTLVDAAESDLKDAFVTTGYAKSVEVTEVELVNPKRIRVAGFITLDEDNTEAFDVEGNIS